jgi:transposase
MNDASRAEIVARFRGGASLRRIARELRISYHSVRRTLREIEQARSGCLMPQPAPRVSQLDTYEPAIRDLLARYPDITAQRVLEEL